MKNIGEALSFYAKYCPEMEILYGDEDFTILDKIDETKLHEVEEKVNKIGNQACEEAADFLEKVTRIMIDAVRSKVGVAQLRRRSTMETNWKTEIQIWPSKVTPKPRSWDYTMGASLLNKNNVLTLFIWFWNKYPQLTPDQIVTKCKVTFPNSFHDSENFHKQTVVLDKMELLPEFKGGVFFINQEPLLTFSQEICTKFSNHTIDDFLKNFS